MTFNNQKPPEDRRVAMLTPSVEIPLPEGSSSNDASSSSRRPTATRPDMAIGTLPAPEERAKLPKSSRDVMFSAGRPPLMALETISSKPGKDLEKKPSSYRQAGVQTLHTLHRDRRGNGKNAFHRIQRLQDGQYETETRPISNEPINDPDACNITSKQLMNSPSPDRNVQENKRKQRAINLSLLRKADEKKSRADTAEKALKSSKKSLRELEEKLKAQISLTSSSSRARESPTNSPSRPPRSSTSSPSSLPTSSKSSPDGNSPVGGLVHLTKHNVYQPYDGRRITQPLFAGVINVEPPHIWQCCSVQSKCTDEIENAHGQQTAQDGRGHHADCYRVPKDTKGTPAMGSARLVCDRMKEYVYSLSRTITQPMLCGEVLHVADSPSLFEPLHISISV